MSLYLTVNEINGGGGGGGCSHKLIFLIVQILYGIELF